MTGRSRNLPPLNHLQAFEAAARHLSFTEAAAELNCTQSAISQRVRSLEKFFSRPLFHRRSNGLVLTEVGAAYLPGVTDALDMAAAATQGLYGKRLANTVTLSAPLSFTTLWLSRHLGEFQAANPATEIRVNSTIWTDPNVDLADLSIEVRDPATLEPGGQPLGPERLVLACQPELARRLGPDIHADALNAFTHIHILGKHQFWDRWSAMHGIARAPAGAPIRVDNAMTALEMAAQGLGLVVSFSTYCAPYLESGRLVAPFGQSAPIALSHVLLEDTRRTPAPPVQRFRAWLTEACRRTMG